MHLSILSIKCSSTLSIKLLSCFNSIISLYSDKYILIVFSAWDFFKFYTTAVEPRTPAAVINATQIGSVKLKIIDKTGIVIKNNNVTPIHNIVIIFENCGPFELESLITIFSPLFFK